VGAIRAFVKMLGDQSGATAAEYALILALVGSTLALGALLLGNTISTALNSTGTSINNCFSNSGC
jgi:pilus assembly protein Flp/PilA